MSENINLHIHTDRADEVYQMTVLKTLDRIITAHSEFREGVSRKLDGILTLLRQSKERELSMATSITDIEQFVADIDQETNDIAARLDRNTATIEALKAQIAAGSPVTQEQLDALGASIAPVVARLQALGSDPQEPIDPEPLPPEEPPVEPTDPNNPNQ